ncbi:DoxX family protein [Erythrobacter litoralis]|uniref:DoxX family protein n=1 Tax=Erythrobacter litoralis TaxID=39960 RepID=UPI002435E8DE|nr:DoxX family protein [Erythrobacter litoralis]MDG6079208.1 DoxX family protein [Erythrobacter litoralis]
MATLAGIIGRILIAILFVLSGATKIFDPASTAKMMNASSPFPGSWALGVGIFEVAAGVILTLGFATRMMAILLIGFTALATLFFHREVTDPTQAAMALKNLAIIGGLLMVFAYGQVRGKMGTWRERDRANDAELRAARAEGRVEGEEAATTATTRAPERPGDRI